MTTAVHDHGVLPHVSVASTVPFLAPLWVNDRNLFDPSSGTIAADLRHCAVFDPKSETNKIKLLRYEFLSPRIGEFCIGEYEGPALGQSCKFCCTLRLHFGIQRIKPESERSCLAAWLRGDVRQIGAANGSSVDMRRIRRIGDHMIH